MFAMTLVSDERLILSVLELVARHPRALSHSNSFPLLPLTELLYLRKGLRRGILSTGKPMHKQESVPKQRHMSSHS